MPVGSGMNFKATCCRFRSCVKSIVVVLLSIPVVWCLLWVDDPRVTLKRLEVVSDKALNKTVLNFDFNVYNPNLFRGIIHQAWWIDVFYFDGKYVNPVSHDIPPRDKHQGSLQNLRYHMNMTADSYAFMGEDGVEQLRRHNASIYMTFYLLVKYKILIWTAETKHRMWLNHEVKDFSFVENNNTRQLTATDMAFDYITKYKTAVRSVVVILM